MGKWRAIAGFGVAGCLLSLLFGMFSGNPFGVIVLRVLFSGVTAALLGFALRFLASRFLPELTGAPPAEPAAAGEHIDIVMPAENPHGSGARDGEEVPEITGEVDLDVADAEEVSGIEGLGAEADISVPEAAEASGSSPAESLAELDSIEVAGAGPSGGEVGVERPESTPAAGSGSGGRRSRKAGELQQQDPEIVARALRTMMRRDEEG